MSVVPDGTHLGNRNRVPSDKSLGYFRTSLRDTDRCRPQHTSPPQSFVGSGSSVASNSIKPPVQIEATSWHVNPPPPCQILQTRKSNRMEFLWISHFKISGFTTQFR